MSRMIWIVLNERQRDTGVLERNTIIERARHIRTKPLRPLNGNDKRFELLESLLRGKGYEPVIFEDGSINITIPIADKYGWILREIATTYYLAQKTWGSF